MVSHVTKCIIYWHFRRWNSLVSADIFSHIFISQKMTVLMRKEIFWERQWVLLCVGELLSPLKALKCEIYRCLNNTLRQRRCQGRLYCYHSKFLKTSKPWTQFEASEKRSALLISVESESAEFRVSMNIFIAIFPSEGFRSLNLLNKSPP